MAGFNPDGSLKLPEKFEKKKAELDHKMKNEEYLKIRKDVVSIKAPKSCKLQLTLSDAFITNFFIDKVYKYWNEQSEVPSKLKKITETEFHIEIGTCLRRCSDCNKLTERFRTFLDGKVIVDKGTCTFEPREYQQENVYYE